MKAVFILLCLAVTAFAVEVNEDFVNSAVEYLKSANHQQVKRSMLNIEGNCNGAGEACDLRYGCCGEDYRCSNWLSGGVCVPKGDKYKSQVQAIKTYFDNLG